MISTCLSTDFSSSGAVCMSWESSLKQRNHFAHPEVPISWSSQFSQCNESRLSFYIYNSILVVRVEKATWVQAQETRVSTVLGSESYSLWPWTLHIHLYLQQVKCKTLSDWNGKDIKSLEVGKGDSATCKRHRIRSSASEHYRISPDCQASCSLIIADCLERNTIFVLGSTCVNKK